MKLINWIEVGVVCTDTNMKHPYVMTEKYYEKTFDEAKELLLNEPSIKKAKVNDLVFLSMSGAEERK